METSSTNKAERMETAKKSSGEEELGSLAAGVRSDIEITGTVEF